MNEKVCLYRFLSRRSKLEVVGTGVDEERVGDDAVDVLALGSDGCKVAVSIKEARKDKTNCQAAKFTLSGKTMSDEPDTTQ